MRAVAGTVAQLLPPAQRAGLSMPLRWGNAIVPYTARWSSEDDTDFEVRETAFGAKRIPLLCETVDSPGVGRPKLSTMHAGRLTEVVTRKLCQICVLPLPSPAWCFGFGETHGIYPLVKDGMPMCEACALTALAQCPTLRQRQADGSLRVFLARGWQPAPAILGFAEPSEGGHERINAAIERWRGRHPTRAFVHGAPALVLRDFAQLPPAAVAAMLAAAQPMEAEATA